MNANIKPRYEAHKLEGTASKQIAKPKTVKENY